MCTHGFVWCHASYSRNALTSYFSMYHSPECDWVPGTSSHWRR